MRNTLYVRDPFRDFDGLVKAAFGPQQVRTARPAGFVPPAESHREGDDLVVSVELPGVDAANDVAVEIIDGNLVISGERRDERSEETEGRRLREFRYGSFKRAFRLGAQINTDQITAAYDAGVLTVRVAGAFAKPEGQKIQISTVVPAAVQAPADEANATE